jgi:Na+/H+ antiporter NhaC
VNKKKFFFIFLHVSKMRVSYTTISITVFALTLLILSAVSYGSVNKASPSDKDIKNAKNSSMGLLIISVILAAICLFVVYGEYQVSAPAKQAIYYF